MGVNRLLRATSGLRRAAAALSVCLLTLTNTVSALAQSAEGFKAELTVRADQPRGTINRNIYGHFAVHLGRLIYGGLFVGEGSIIPKAGGYRKDVLGAWKGMKVPVLRGPGG